MTEKGAEERGEAQLWPCHVSSVTQVVLICIHRMAGLEEFQGPFSKLLLATRLGLLVLERALHALCQCLRDTHCIF